MNDECVSQEVIKSSVGISTNKLNVLLKLKMHVDVIKITAADYNGHNFDGTPFESAVEGRGISPAFFSTLDDYINQGVIKLSTAGCTDYATWDFINRDGVIRNYGPGDFILFTKEIGLIPFHFEQMEAVLYLLS